YSSPRSAARFWRVRERRELDGKYRRNGSLNLCIRERPMKKAHLLRCARPTRSNVPQRVRLRSSVFARLASETFLIGLTGLLIGDIKRRKSILLFSLVVWPVWLPPKRQSSRSPTRRRWVRWPLSGWRKM